MVLDHAFGNEAIVKGYDRPGSAFVKKKGYYGYSLKAELDVFLGWREENDQAFHETAFGIGVIFPARLPRCTK